MIDAIVNGILLGCVCVCVLKAIQVLILAGLDKGK